MTGWHGTLALSEHPDGVVVEGADEISYDLARNEAHFGPVELAGHALVWTLTPGEQAGDRALLAHAVVLDDDDELDRPLRPHRLPAGGHRVHAHASRAGHPLPGRGLAAGRDRGRRDASYAAGGAWFESGPEAVLATAATDRPSAFVRVLLLPEAWAGKRTIRYVDEEDEAKPKLQRPTVFLEVPLTLAR